MQSQKGFIQIPILIAIIASILVLGAGYFGAKQYQDYHAEKVEQRKQTETYKQAEEERRQKFQEMLDSQNEALEKQKIEIEILKNQSNTAPNVPSKLVELSRADIIAQWTPSVAYVVCKFSMISSQMIANLREDGVDIDPVILAGSGFIRSITTEHSSTPVIAVITNRHILNAHNGFSSPSACDVILPGNHIYTIDGADIFYFNDSLADKKDEVKLFNGQPYVIPRVDAGWLWIKNPDKYINDLARKPKLCGNKPRIGDDIIILGYPAVGSSVGITATEGIVSGLEGAYFVTSAKVEHGNSGGAAIYKDQNCYFGIPTFTKSGSVESLARILDFDTVFK